MQQVLSFILTYLIHFHHHTRPNSLLLHPASTSTTKMIDQHIFEDLQNKIDEEVQVREVNPPLSALCPCRELFACQARVQAKPLDAQQRPVADTCYTGASRNRSNTCQKRYLIFNLGPGRMAFSTEWRKCLTRLVVIGIVRAEGAG